MVDFNIPITISQLSNLQRLWIDAAEPQKVTATTSFGAPKVTYKSVVVSDLRKEMTGPLPLKLREITIAGTGFTQIADNILVVSTPITPYFVFDLSLKSTIRIVGAK